MNSDRVTWTPTQDNIKPVTPSSLCEVAINPVSRCPLAFRWAVDPHNPHDT